MPSTREWPENRPGPLTRHLPQCQPCCPLPDCQDLLSGPEPSPPQDRKGLQQTPALPRSHPPTLRLEERALTRLAIWPLTSPEPLALAQKAALIQEGKEPLLASWPKTLTARSASLMGRRGTSLRSKEENRQAPLYLGLSFFFFFFLF